MKPWRLYAVRILAGLGWLIAAVLVVLEVLRLLHVDERSTRLIAISTAWPLVVLPGLVVVALALTLRRRLLGVAAAVMMVIIVAAWWPAWTGRIGPGPPNAQRLRLLALNVEYSQNTGAAVSRQVAEVQPDVVVLSELSPLTLRHLDLSQFRYRWERPTSGAFGQGIYSRWPLVSREKWTDSGITMVIVTVRTPTGDVRLYQVHTNAPRGQGPRRIWVDQLKQLRGYLHTEQEMPVIAAGDFNASAWDRRFDDLLGGPAGIRDAAAGRGYRATWPSGRSYPLLLPLDHVLISRGIGVRSYRVLGPVGSDHRGVLTDLTVARR
jgi:endonuclease/exonuclease/phosphatase (EEP) superfamily protein YafD